MADFQDQHRIFVQGMMWKKILSAEEVHHLHRLCCQKSNAQPGELKSFVEKINNALKPLNMVIDKGIDEITGDHYYVLINTCDNDISKLSSDYLPHELELFKKIIFFIVETGEGKASSTEILNLADDLTRNTTKREADEIINKFSKDNWLLEKDGYIFFSTRAIVELQQFFRDYVEDIHKCKLCASFVFQGATCLNCNTKIHHHCKSRWIEMKKKDVCPTCNASFDS